MALTLAQAKAGNFNLNRYFSNYYQVLTWPVTLELGHIFIIKLIISFSSTSLQNFNAGGMVDFILIISTMKIEAVANSHKKY